MKVLHVIKGLDPQAGGPPVVALSLAAAQAAIGIDASIAISQSKAGDDDPRAAFPQIPGLGRVVIHRVDAPPFFQLLLGRGDTQALRHLVQQHDVVHLHGVWEPVLLAAARVCQHLQKPYVVLLNGMLEPWPLSQKRWKKKLALELVYRSMLNGASAVHVLNEDERAFTAQLGIKSDLRVIPNGIFDEQMDRLPAPGRFRAAHAEIGERSFILFMGRLNVVKGLDILADAFALVAAANPDVRLVVVGPDGGAQSAFVSQLERLGIRDRVLLTGPIYGEAKYDALVDATCFCLPSRQEAFSVAILEALACGKPAIISDQCHFPEVGEVGAGIVCPLSPDVLTQKLLLVLSDSSLRQQMGESARRLVRERFTWSHVARATAVLYEDLVSDNH